MSALSLSHPSSARSGETLESHALRLEAPPSPESSTQDIWQDALEKPPARRARRLPKPKPLDPQSIYRTDSRGHALKAWLGRDMHGASRRLLNNHAGELLAKTSHGDVDDEPQDETIARDFDALAELFDRKTRPHTLNRYLQDATRGSGYFLGRRGYFPSLSVFAGNQIWVDGMPIDASCIAMHVPHRVDYIATSTPDLGCGLRNYYAMLWNHDVTTAVALTAASWWPLPGVTKVFDDVSLRGESLTKHTIPMMEAPRWHALLSEHADALEKMDPEELKDWFESFPIVDTSLATLRNEVSLNSEAHAYVVHATLMRGEHSKPLTALVFEEWPDMFPLHGRSLAQLIQLVDQHHTGGPLAVHCMGGIGRTGTFIASHALHQQVRTRPAAAAYSLLLENTLRLRCQRPRMIECADQLAGALASVSFHPGDRRVA